MTVPTDPWYLQSGALEFLTAIGTVGGAVAAAIAAWFAKRATDYSAKQSEIMQQEYLLNSRPYFYMEWVPSSLALNVGSLELSTINCGNRPLSARITNVKIELNGKEISAKASDLQMIVFPHQTSPIMFEITPDKPLSEGHVTLSIEAEYSALNDKNFSYKYAATMIFELKNGGGKTTIKNLEAT